MKFNLFSAVCWSNSCLGPESRKTDKYKTYCYWMLSGWYVHLPLGFKVLNGNHAAFMKTV
jgi:hypothetical protein